MDKYNFESIHDWTYSMLCEEVERVSKMELSTDKMSKLASLLKVAELYRVVTKTKMLLTEDNRLYDDLNKYDIPAFFGNNDLDKNQKLLKILRGRIKTKLMEENVKLGYEMDAQFKRIEMLMDPPAKPPKKIIN